MQTGNTSEKSQLKRVYAVFDLVYQCSADQELKLELKYNPENCHL